MSDPYTTTLGSPATSAQMEVVISMRNAQAIDAEIQEIQRTRANPMRCPCGYDTVEFAIAEVASVHLCPNCRKIHLIGPDSEVMDLVSNHWNLTKERYEADRRAVVAERRLADFYKAAIVK